MDRRRVKLLGPGESGVTGPPGRGRKEFRAVVTLGSFNDDPRDGGTGGRLLELRAGMTGGAEALKELDADFDERDDPWERTDSVSDEATSSAES